MGIRWLRVPAGVSGWRGVDVSVVASDGGPKDRRGVGDADRAFATTLAADEGRDEAVEAARAEAQALERDRPALGAPGPPLNRRSPYLVGFLAAAGALTAYGLARLTLGASSVLALLLLALF